MLKRLIVAISILASLFMPAYAFAQGTTTQPAGVDVRIGTPTQGVNPAVSVGVLLSSALTIVFVIAALAVLFMLIFGAFQWITSGGEKEAIDKARKRITSALIGLAILALAFFITRVVGQVVGINITSIQQLPTLGGCGVDKVLNPQTGTCDVRPPAIPQGR
jgi:hypothetical protein